jgi:hypothetical protein
MVVYSAKIVCQITYPDGTCTELRLLPPRNPWTSLFAELPDEDRKFLFKSRVERDQGSSYSAWSQSAGSYYCMMLKGNPFLAVLQVVPARASWVVQGGRRVSWVVPCGRRVASRKTHTRDRFELSGMIIINRFLRRRPHPYPLTGPIPVNCFSWVWKYLLILLGGREKSGDRDQGSSYSAWSQWAPFRLWCWRSLSKVFSRWYPMTANTSWAVVPCGRRVASRKIRAAFNKRTFRIIRYDNNKSIPPT